MPILFETIKLLFFFLTLIMSLVFWKGSAIRGSGVAQNIHTLFTPAYLVLMGILLAYILAFTINHPENTHEQTNKLYIKMFLAGLLMGITLALVYIFA